MKTVTPTVRANGLWNRWSGRKKWTITCGSCGYTWREKVPIIEPSTAICPACKALNKWSIVEFDRQYDRG